MKPVTRYETYLAKLGGQDVEIPAPVTRKEAFLAKACGEEVTEITAVTRREMFLDNLSGGNHDIAPVTRIEALIAKAAGAEVREFEPVTREEMFWSQVEGGSGDSWITLEGDIVRFSASRSVPFRSLQAAIEPAQPGSGDPSSSNIRPISGWTGANVTRTGINVWDEEWEAGLLNSDGSVSSGSRIVSKDYISVVPNKTYCFSLPNGIYAVGRGAYYDADKNLVQYLGDFPTNFSVAGDRQFALFTVPENASYLKFCVNGQYGATYKNDISINYPSTDTDYHSGKGNAAYDITFPSAAGTVYGGTLDVTTGKLRVTHGHIASYAGEALPGEWLSDRDVYSAGATPTNGAQVVYALATPVEYTLTPTEVTTLIGTNNVWADCGDVTVEAKGQEI